MPKKFTILTATYNSKRYIREWADSILWQKYRPLEVVCVDDKSKDSTVSILKDFVKEFEKNDISLKVISSSKKIYCGSAYNLALKNATGSYFGVLDSDDMLEPFACEFIVRIYEKYHKINWIYTQYNKYNRTMTRVIKKGFCNCPGKNKTILLQESRNKNTYGHWRTFSDRLSNMDNLFGKGLRCCVDKHLGIRMEEIGRGMFVDKICYRYRTRIKGEKSIVHLYKLKDVRAMVVRQAKKRRREGKKVYSISKYKD